MLDLVSKNIKKILFYTKNIIFKNFNKNKDLCSGRPGN